MDTNKAIRFEQRFLQTVCSDLLQAQIISYSLASCTADTACRPNCLCVFLQFDIPASIFYG